MGTGEPSETRADAAQLNQLAQLVTETMEASNYSPQGMFAANRHDLDLLLRRLNPNSHDTRRLLGLFRRILWRLRRGSRQPSTPS